MTTKNVENKKIWVAPKLKKIDIEQLTASGVQVGHDAGSKS